MSLLPGIWGQDAACLATVLAAVNPGVGGVLLAGPHGTAKSTIARRLRRLLPADRPFVTLPLSAEEECLVGGIDLERTVREGRRVVQPGLFARARGGALFIDDLHLLPRDLASLLAGAEGVLLVATANLAEGDVSPHLLDRFGLAAAMADLRGPDQRRGVLTAALAPLDSTLFDPVASRIEVARHRLAGLPRLSGRVQESIAALVEKAACPGHRGELFLAEASRALAAWEGAPSVAVAHVERIAPLVLDHRRRKREKTPPPPSPSDGSADAHGERSTDAPPAPPPSRDGSGQGGEQPAEAGKDGDASSESSAREEIMAVGETFSVRRITLEKDRKKRRCSGRRTKSLAKGPDGRTIRAEPQGARADIHLVATLRAAAPFQALRGRRNRVLIEEQDLRYRRRERRIGHLVLFVVDGSGSMGAQKRMVLVKGAIQSLLLECHQKRDRVALVLFRKDRAELVLPPTRSVELAGRCLATLPVGGKTPLTAGLAEAARVAKQARRREPDLRVLLVLLSDGRANQSMGAGKPLSEATRAAAILAETPGVDTLVVDTEDKHSFHRTDMARALAAALGGRYSTMEGLASVDLAALVRQTRIQ